MKTKYQDKYKKLEQEISAQIEALIEKKGVESEFSNTQVLKLKDAQQYNLEGCNTYAVELAVGSFIGHNGHAYHHSVLSLEKLCEIVDSF